jgi:hypothetical protein
MSITQRCNYAGSFGKLIPTRSFAFAVFTRMQGWSTLLPRRRK